VVLLLEGVHSLVVDRRDRVVVAGASMVVDERTFAVVAEDKCPKEPDIDYCNRSRTNVLVDATRLVGMRGGAIHKESSRRDMPLVYLH
jgi:hypothetical protein